MPRSPKQMSNDIRLIVVASLAKEFRKSKIITKIINIAKSRNMVASGNLVNPKKSNSILPVSDDRWLVDRNSVKVILSTTGTGLPSSIKIMLSPKYGLDDKYLALASQTPKKAWFPNVYRIQDWVEKKGIASGKDAKSVGWAIAKSIAKKGIKKTNIANPFFYKKTGYDATAQRGINNASSRIVELYGEFAVEYIDESITNIFG
jgi:hypothetical protein